MSHTYNTKLVKKQVITIQLYYIVTYKQWSLDTKTSTTSMIAQVILSIQKLSLMHCDSLLGCSLSLEPVKDAREVYSWAAISA